MTGRARHVIASASSVLRTGLFLNFSIHQAHRSINTLAFNHILLHPLLTLCRLIKRSGHCSNGFHRFTTRSSACASATWSRSPADRWRKRYLAPRDLIAGTNCDYHACFLKQRAAIQHGFGCYTISHSAAPTSATLTLCKYWLATSSWLAYSIFFSLHPPFIFFLLFHSCKCNTCRKILLFMMKIHWKLSTDKIKKTHFCCGYCKHYESNKEANYKSFDKLNYLMLSSLCWIIISLPTSSSSIGTISMSCFISVITYLLMLATVWQCLYQNSLIARSLSTSDSLIMSRSN